MVLDYQFRVTCHLVDIMASHPPTKGTIEDRKKVIQTLHECCGGYAIVHNEVLGHKPQLAQKSDVSTGADDGSIVDKVKVNTLVAMPTVFP